MEGGDAVGKRRASGEGLLRWRKDRKHWEGRITIGSDDGTTQASSYSFAIIEYHKGQGVY